jgi:RNA recognition motif-containing protein
MNPRLYVGNLPPGVSESDLRLLFSRAGSVTDVQIMLDPATQKSRGFAFVTMATPELAAAALKDFHCHNLGGRHITVTEARPPQEPKGLMSEGFDVGPSNPFKSGSQRDKTHRRSGGSHHRHHRRGRGR